MGVGSGQSQTDVTQLAYILTGWSDRRAAKASWAKPGTFVFNANAHEPTAATLLGPTSTWRMASRRDEAALADITREAATANHIAFKFARHFVAGDAPDAGLVQAARRGRSARPTAIWQTLATRSVNNNRG